MTKSYHDDELDHAPAALLGGPLDGKRYSLPLFPEHHGPAHGFASPLTGPPETSAYAHYTLASDELIGGYYVYIFEKITPPEHAVEHAAERESAIGEPGPTDYLKERA